MNKVDGITRFCLLVLIASTGVSASEPGVAHAYLTEKFFFDAGIYFPDRKLRISVEGTDLVRNNEIDFGDLDFKRSDQTAAFNFGWKLSPHWKLAAQYFGSSDDATGTLDENIEWGDEVFPVGANVGFGQKFSLLRTLIGYEFNDSDHHAFGIGGGLHILDISAYIEGDVTVGNATAFSHQSVSAVGLLPNIGSWYRYSFAEKWVLTARVDWLSAKIGDYDGRLINASAGINYQMFDHFGIGANYNFFELDVGVNKTDWVGKAVTSYDGLFVYLSAYW
jgi:hypothetical protein